MTKENQYYASLLDCLLDEINVKYIEIETQYICDGKKLFLTYDGDFTFILDEKDVTTEKLLTLVPGFVDKVLNSRNK